MKVEGFSEKVTFERKHKEVGDPAMQISGGVASQTEIVRWSLINQEEVVEA